MIRSLLPYVICACVLGITNSSAMGATVSWADWTSATAGYPGSASGFVTLLDTSTITVGYTGELRGAQTNGTGTNFWNPDGAYLSTTVENAPPGTDILQLNGPTSTEASITNTITFSATVTNPVIAILSMGSGTTAIQYDFSAAFTVLSEGMGYFGDGTYQLLAGDILEGREFHGVLQFQGSFDEISWTITGAEWWHGVTVGVVNVPEPSSLLLVGSGLLGLMASSKRLSM